MHEIARANPLAGNPFESRADLQRAVRDLVSPLLPHMSPGRARVRLGSFASVFPMADAELEGFARPLFGLAPLAAGGGEFAHWERFREGIISGVDPDHEEHWTLFTGTAQTMVEQAALGLALALIPEQIFDPLPDRAKQQLVTWLKRIEQYEPVQNNWQFFRILVQRGLARVGAPVDEDAQERSLALLDGFYVGDGWYADGTGGARDHYVGWAFHAYGLIFAKLLPDHPLAATFRARARRFAQDFEAWFDPEGGVVAFGRSLTYRFAAAGFFSALAFAEEEALPWGQVKGHLLRHLRFWTELPISDRDGVLSVGWSYTNPWMRETYNSAGSPYWAMKAFLCLALPEEHAFWQADEVPAAPGSSAQEAPGMLLARDASHAVALSGGHGTTSTLDQAAAKYGRLAYSSRFGPTIEASVFGRTFAGDSALLFAEPDAQPRLSREILSHHVGTDFVYSRWSAGPGVVVHTLLAGGAPWHLRLHRVETDRTLVCHETGFAVGDWEALATGFDSGEGFARIDVAEGLSSIHDLSSGRVPRAGRAQPLPPNASLTRPYCAMPMLRCELEAGTHELSCAVFASTQRAHPLAGQIPELADELRSRLLEHAGD